MGVIYVTSLRHGEGRTAFCSGLAQLLRARGLRPSLFKPVRAVQPGAQPLPDADAVFFANLQGTSIPDSWPVDVQTNQIPSTPPSSIQEKVQQVFREITSPGQDVIVEGPPLEHGFTGYPDLARDLAEALDARVVLLARYSYALKPQDIQGSVAAFGNRLAGVVLNAVPRYRKRDAEKDLVEPLQAQSVPVLAVLPEERCLLGIAVGDLAEHLRGEFLLGDEKRHQMVDHYTIGGMVLEWGVNYFGQSETKAVIVRGDRPDIQMAALHTATRCLVLSGGHRPIQYVEHEAKALGVPIVLVQSDTLSTARALASLFERVTIHHTEKADCFAQALGQTRVLNTLSPWLEKA